MNDGRQSSARTLLSTTFEQTQTVRSVVDNWPVHYVSNQHSGSVLRGHHHHVLYFMPAERSKITGYISNSETDEDKKEIRTN